MSVANHKLSFEITANTGARAAVKLAGDLDESSAEVLFRLKNALNAVPDIIVDTAGVSRVNSAGMAHYSKFAQDLAGSRIRYVNCSSSFIDFAIMLPGILTNATVGSFYATYYCQACDDEFYRLVDNEAACKIKTAPCPKCSAPKPAVGFLEELQATGVVPSFLQFVSKSR